jgi:hypothetical protein
MRPMVVAVTAVVTMSVAGAVLAPSSVLAAPKQSMRTQMEAMRAKDPQSFAACEMLARQRGLSTADLGNNLMMFIDGCMMGKQR